MKNILKIVFLVALIAAASNEGKAQSTTPPLPQNNNQSNGKKKDTDDDKDKDKDKDKAKQNDLPPSNIFGSDNSKKHKHRKK